MLSAIDHVGVAVESIDDALALYRDQLGMPLVHRETVSEQGVDAALLDVGDSHVELLQPLGPETAVGKFLSRRGPGLHHVAYRVGARHPLEQGAAGKAILADTGYGANGVSAGHDANWDMVNNLNARIEAMSKWVVGSSMRSRLGGLSSSLTRPRRVFSPPESTATFL